MYIDMDILRIMHEYVFVFMLVAVFTATFCAGIILFDGNPFCFSPFYTLLPQERRRELGDLPVCVNRHMVFCASSVNMHFIFLYRFLCTRVNLAQCPCK